MARVNDGVNGLCYCRISGDEGERTVASRRQVFCDLVRTSDSAMSVLS